MPTYLQRHLQKPQQHCSITCDRLRESESTFQKHLAWAQGQITLAAAPGLFDFSLQDTSNDEAYTALKEALATLSPEVRNSMHETVVLSVGAASGTVSVCASFSVSSRSCLCCSKCHYSFFWLLTCQSLLGECMQ